MSRHWTFLRPALTGLWLWGLGGSAPVAAQTPTVRSLEEDAGDAEEEELVVRDRRTAEATDPQSTSASVTVIEVDDRLPASSDVSTVVDSASGTTVQRLGGLGDWAGVSIRGSSVRQVQVVLDGIPLNPDGVSAVNLSELPLWAFQRVEIFRGSAPPELAASPIGGVVHLRTGRGRDGTRAALSYGSLDTARLAAMSRVDREVRGTPAQVLAIADVFRTTGDFRYYADNGTEYNRLDDHLPYRENNDKQQLNTHLRLRYGHPGARLSVLQAWLSREEGLPGHANAPTQRVRLQTRRSLTALSGDLTAGEARLEARSWLMARGDTFDDRQGELGVGTQHNLDRFRSIGVLLHGKRALGAPLVGGLTLAARQDHFATTALQTQTEGPGAQRWAFTPALDADLRLWSDRLTLSPVAQASIIDNRAVVEAPSGAVSEDLLLAPTPRLGALLLPVPRLALKANVGRYVRPPDVTELFGDRGAIVGNPRLQPERGLQWDVGLRTEAPDAMPIDGSFELAYFQNAVEDLIVLVQNSQRTSVPVNLDRGWVGGVEAALTLRTPFVESQTNLTRTRSVNLSSEPQYANNQLPRVPALELSQRTALVWKEAVRVGHSWSFTDGNYWDRTNLYRSAPRAFHNLFARYQPRGPWPAFEVEARNLTDRIVEVVPRNPLNPDDPARVVQPTTDFVGYPLPGRTVLGTIRWEYP